MILTCLKPSGKLSISREFLLLNTKIFDKNKPESNKKYVITTLYRNGHFVWSIYIVLDTLGFPNIVGVYLLTNDKSWETKVPIWIETGDMSTLKTRVIVFIPV